MHCTTIAPERPFLDTLAGWLLAEYGREPEILPKLTVLLPGRRACRSLRDAFLQCTQGKPLLLPRMLPIGELTEDTLWLHGPQAEIPAAMPALRRELMLTRLVYAYNRAAGEQQQGHAASLEQALQLAGQLARFLDEMARESLNFDSLENLVPGEYSRHWQETVTFLNIISHQWPNILAAEGCTDASTQRATILEATARAWQLGLPGPVVAAGVTSAAPAVARLLGVVARNGQGMVVLPGLDTALPEGEWDTLEETHPQYGLKRLLEAMGCKRAQVRPLLPAPESARTQLLRAVLAPPAATAQWPQAKLPLHEGLKGVSLLAADTLHDEARMIAVWLRETLEIPEKTAALVTPNRQLARMVAAQLQRFGIAIDDSGGIPLSQLPAGAFLRLLAEMAAERAAPAALLALLRHPLAACGVEPAACRRLSRQLELRLLRGPRLAPGLGTVLHAARHPAGDKRKEPLSAEAIHFVAELEAHARPFMALFESTEERPLEEFLRAHVALAEWMADTPGQGCSLWKGDAGEQLAAFLAELLENAAHMPPVPPQAYAGVLDLLLGAQVFRPRFGSHPRLHILGPIEARLQRFDRIILGGLNEGDWPAGSSADPWMSRPMRQAFGLPSPERATGQGAHDVAMLCASPEVFLTRAQKVDGSPTIASRWLVRLHTLIEGLDKALLHTLDAGPFARAALSQLDAPAPLPSLSQPCARPPVSARPRNLHVTAIDAWLSNPYGFYAKYVLALRKLDELDQEPGAADFGNMVHAAMEAFTKANPRGLPPDLEAQLLSHGREAFSRMADRPAVAVLWWPRYESMVPWLAQQERTRRGQGAECFAEVRASWTFSPDGAPFTLQGRMDRLDIAGGVACIVDYKTGTVPTQKKIRAGLANQLPLLALLVEHGRLEGAPPAARVEGLEYWKLGGAGKCEVMQVGAEFVKPAQARLEQLVGRYASETQTYDAPSYATQDYDDYAHFTRRQEWEPV